jgi:ribosomal protein S21
VREGNLDKALRVLRRKLDRASVPQEVRRRLYAETRGQRRRRKKSAATWRTRRAAESEQGAS